MVLFFMLGYAGEILAGGAVAATKQKQAVAGQQQKLLQQQMQQRQWQQAPPQAAPRVDESEIEDVVDINELWKQFETTSEAWMLIADPEAKVMTVAHYVDFFARQGTKIRKPPTFYVGMIDAMAAESPPLLSNPFDKIMTLVAILEYDFDNGENPDQLAHRFLGQEQYRQNRQRLGLP